MEQKILVREKFSRNGFLFTSAGQGVVRTKTVRRTSEEWDAASILRVESVLLDVRTL